MKFSLVKHGTRAEKPASFKFYENDVAILLRPLSLAEEIDTAAAAIAMATAKKSEPKPGNAIYDAALMAATLHVCCIDPDSSPEARTSVFDGGVDQVLKELDGDTTALLYEQQQIWQEECSPTLHKVSLGELFNITKKLAEDEHDPLAFLRLSPRMRVTLARFMAALLRTSQVLNTEPGSSSASTRASDEKPQPEPKEETPSSPEDSLTSPTRTDP